MDDYIYDIMVGHQCGEAGGVGVLTMLVMDLSKHLKGGYIWMNDLLGQGPWKGTNVVGLYSSHCPLGRRAQG